MTKLLNVLDGECVNFLVHNLDRRRGKETVRLTPNIEDSYLYRRYKTMFHYSHKDAINEVLKYYVEFYGVSNTYFELIN